MKANAAGPRVCVIGAGASGLVSAKALLDRRISFTCFEASDRVGGLWVFKNKAGSAAYRSLAINTSRDRMQFREFPMPRNYPDYPLHPLIASYLESYAERFELLRHIRFETRVLAVKPRADAGFDVTTRALASDTQETSRFDAVIVANGHHVKPRFPSPAPAGHFAGSELHAHDYIDPDEPCALRGKRVVVVGIGNSAVDIASELARVRGDGAVFLSVRRGAWVLPKYAFGKPLDEASAMPRFIPRRLQKLAAELWYRMAVGDPRRFGLPAPDHRLGDAHPTVSSDLFSVLGSGALVAKPAIVRFDEERVEFADGSVESIDAIVYATGYQLEFPFFEPEFLAAPDNELPLYFRVFHPSVPCVYFVGLCQPLGPIMPIAEAQAGLIAAHLDGDYTLPSASDMQRVAARERARVRARFGDSPRHTMQVDFDEYLAALARERKAGALRTPRAPQNQKNRTSAG